MKALVAVDSSPSSERVLEQAVARPWPAGTSFSIANVVDVQRFARLPALIEDATYPSVSIGFCVSVVTMGPCMRWTKYSRRFYRQLTTHTSAVTAIAAEKSNYHYRLLQIRARVRAEGRQLP